MKSRVRILLVFVFSTLFVSACIRSAAENPVLPRRTHHQRRRAVTGMQTIVFFAVRRRQRRHCGVGPGNVLVSNGLFAVTLGAGTPITIPFQQSTVSGCRRADAEDGSAPAACRGRVCLRSHVGIGDGAGVHLGRSRRAAVRRANLTSTFVGVGAQGRAPREFGIPPSAQARLPPTTWARPMPRLVSLRSRTIRSASAIPPSATTRSIATAAASTTPPSAIAHCTDT